MALPLDDPATRKIQFSSPGPSLPIAAVATSSCVFNNVPRQPASRKGFGPIIFLIVNPPVHAVQPFCRFGMSTRGSRIAPLLRGWLTVECFLAPVKPTRLHKIRSRHYLPMLLHARRKQHRAIAPGVLSKGFDQGLMHRRIIMSKEQKLVS